MTTSSSSSKRARTQRSSKRGLISKRQQSYSIAISVPWKDGGVFTLKWLSHNLVDASVSQTHPLEISQLTQSMGLMVYAMWSDLTEAINGCVRTGPPSKAGLSPTAAKTP